MGKPLCLVAGAGGFIGGHLVKALLQEDVYAVRGVDIKPVSQWHQTFQGVENCTLDLRNLTGCRFAIQGADQIYNLAADMGGMGFIETHKLACMESVLINTNLLRACRERDTTVPLRYFFSSSACVYSAARQTTADVTALEEGHAYPAMPEDGYGWEKLFSERLCRHALEDAGIETRVARYHNVYGIHGTFEGGREKAPAAICRKVAEAKRSGNHTIEIWGDGQQTRSFMHVDDCARGTIGIMRGSFSEPVNLGSAELVTINQLVTFAEQAADITLERIYNLEAPQGVRGRNSDNTLFRGRYGWEPSTPLRQGIAELYAWVESQLTPP